ncbi:hypothetical protein TSUD_212660 [Trifolium subterraneum]|uniref:Uncharacterized protein n=1 Tax=Trifolium subterraneum TaxID=3900 RepID=A0A2Z6NDR2_TRISU|nr:hypothetical protein TSUD_212660 [Trifolium subterraneum]
MVVVRDLKVVRDCERNETWEEGKGFMESAIVGENICYGCESVCDCVSHSPLLYFLSFSSTEMDCTRELSVTLRYYHPLD